MADIPAINGNYFDFASIQIVTTLGRHVGVTDISYGDSIEVGSVYGTSRKRIGRTEGRSSHDGSFTMLKESFQALIRQLGSFGTGYGTVPFNITVNYAEDATGKVFTDILHGCRITGASDTHSEGVEALRVAVTLDVMDITRDGISILTRATT